jgi:hypothetical protein
VKKLLLALGFLCLSSQLVGASFGGGIYDDATAQPAGLGGTDSRCVGSYDQEVSGVGFRVESSRLNENNDGTIISNSYSVATQTNAGDYTVIVNLPYPPPDPANAWQCACNANPLDAFQCIYTNQDPDTGGNLNFFVKRANVQNNAWWQVLGGSVFSKYNIQSLIPVSFANTPGYCNTTPGCLPALIGSDIQGDLNSPGFAFSLDGTIFTHPTGTSFIHYPNQRDSDVQASAMGSNLPTENYAFFAKKLLADAAALPSSQKPSAPNLPTIYRHQGSLTIGPANQWHLANTEQLIVLIDENLVIDDTPGAQNRLVTVQSGGTGFLAFIVKGDIIITPNVGYTNLSTSATDPNSPLVEGVFVSDGIIQVQSYQTVPDHKFIAAGTFVGWTGIDLQRSYATSTDNSVNNRIPAETFVFRPDFLVNTPGIMKAAHFHIREIQPQKLQ